MEIVLSEQSITGVFDGVFLTSAFRQELQKIRLRQGVIIIRIGKLWTIHEYSRLVLVDQVVSL